MTSDDESLSQSRAVAILKRRSLTSKATPRSDQLMAQIRFLASVTERVILGVHAQERMCERGITPEDVYFVLRYGDIEGQISAGIDAGEWKCKVVGQPRGSRQVGVATVMLLVGKLFVKTVEWEDQ